MYSLLYSCTGSGLARGHQGPRPRARRAPAAWAPRSASGLGARTLGVRATGTTRTGNRGSEDGTRPTVTPFHGHRAPVIARTYVYA